MPSTTNKVDDPCEECRGNVLSASPWLHQMHNPLTDMPSSSFKMYAPLQITSRCRHFVKAILVSPANHVHLCRLLRHEAPMYKSRRMLTYMKATPISHGVDNVNDKASPARGAVESSSSSPAQVPNMMRPSGRIRHGWASQETVGLQRYDCKSDIQATQPLFLQ